MSEEGRAFAEERSRERIAGIRMSLAAFLKPDSGGTVLEIGCGHGHWLVSLAEKEPEKQFVGIDLISRRIRMATQKVQRRNLENVLFLKAEAMETMKAWSDLPRVDRIFLLHPDPWPKKRHRKNRLTGPDFLHQMARITRPGGELYFRTDDGEFFAWSEEQIAAHPSWERRNLPWPHEAGSYFRDLLGVHGCLSAARNQ